MKNNKLIIRMNRNMEQVKSQNAYTSNAMFETENGEEVYGELFISYTTPVAALINGVWFFDPISYSPTTSKQISQYTGMYSQERKQYLEDNPERSVSFLQ